MILDSAAEEGISPVRYIHAATDDEQRPAQVPQERAESHARGDDWPAHRTVHRQQDDHLNAIDSRLDDLSVQLDRLTRATTETQPPAARLAAVRTEPDAPTPITRIGPARAETAAQAAAPTPGAENSELAGTLRALEARIADIERESTARTTAPAHHVAETLAQIDRRPDSIVAEGRVAPNGVETRIAAVDRALSALNHDTASPLTASAPLQGEPAGAPQPTPFHQGPSDHHFAAVTSRPTNPAYAAAVAAALPNADDYRPILAVPRGAHAADDAAPVREATQGNPTFGLQRALSDPTFALDTALAEISARQKALEDSMQGPSGIEQRVADLSNRLAERDEPSEPSAPDLQGMRDAAPPAGDGVFGLQEQIAQLSQQIGSLRQADGTADAVAALRQDLAEISRVLTDAVPRRALEALEAEIRALGERVDIGRSNGVDATMLAAIESGLADVREALRQVAPAESLEACREDVRSLDRKIDLIAETKPDATALRPLESAVSELKEIASHAATGEALTALAEQVQTLGDRIDRFVIPASRSVDMLSSMDTRLQELATSINTRGPEAEAASAQLILMVEALAEKIDKTETPANPVLDQITNQLSRLAVKFEASTTRLENLDSIERNMADLFARIDDLRTTTTGAAERAAKAAAKEAAQEAISSAALPSPIVDTLKSDLETLKTAHAQKDQRTQDTLEAVHDTLERLVDRLAMVETDMRSEVRPTSLTTVPFEHSLQARVAELTAALPRSLTTPAPAPRATPTGSGILTVPSDERIPLDPSLPPDHPLEPGTSSLRARANPSPAERIAASEAVLGGAKPSTEPDSKSNFIAAARRAAQAAASMAVPAGGAADESNRGQSTLSKVAQKITGRRPLMIAAAILIMSGALHVVLNVLSPSGGSRVEASRTAPSETAAPAPARTGSAPAKLLTSLATSQTPATHPTTAAERDPSRDANTSLPSPPEREAPTPKRNDSSSAATIEPEAATTPTVSPLTIASIKLPSGADITGSTARSAGFTLPNNMNGPRGSAKTPAELNKLPDGIGSGLRAAAVAGNPAAAYEVASRYAEGRGVAPNTDEAARWFERAADSGLAPAQYRLGSLYEKGQGVKKDLEKARSLYMSAADKGHAKAMHNLAVLYAEGIDGAPDFKVAGQWFRRAAQHNVADSQYNLGILHARGLGVEQNLAESYKWFSLAAQQGDKDAAKKRDEVEARLDQQALVAARLAVQTFVATPHPEEANAVKAPDGGWEGTGASTPPAKPKSGASRKSRTS